jgi:hypothetical protein
LFTNDESLNLIYSEVHIVCNKNLCHGIFVLYSADVATY